MDNVCNVCIIHILYVYIYMQKKKIIDTITILACKNFGEANLYNRVMVRMRARNRQIEQERDRARLVDQLQREHISNKQRRKIKILLVDIYYVYYIYVCFSMNTNQPFFFFPLLFLIQWHICVYIYIYRLTHIRVHYTQIHTLTHSTANSVIQLLILAVTSGLSHSLYSLIFFHLIIVLHTQSPQIVLYIYIDISLRSIVEHNQQYIWKNYYYYFVSFSSAAWLANVIQHLQATA